VEISKFDNDLEHQMCETAILPCFSSTREHQWNTTNAANPYAQENAHAYTNPGQSSQLPTFFNKTNDGVEDKEMSIAEDKVMSIAEDKVMSIAEECSNTSMADALVANSVHEFKDEVPTTYSITPLARQLVAPVAMVDSPLQMVKQDQPKSEDGDEIGDDVFYQGIF
jgi:hypothetical protein